MLGRGHGSATRCKVLKEHKERRILPMLPGWMPVLQEWVPVLRLKCSRNRTTSTTGVTKRGAWPLHAVLYTLRLADARPGVLR